jgi:peptide/nickel transport system substrate-binding protein
MNILLGHKKKQYKRYFLYFFSVTIILGTFLTNCVDIPNQPIGITQTTVERNLPTIQTTELTVPTVKSLVPQATKMSPSLVDRLVICTAPVPVPINPFTNVSMSTTVFRAINDEPFDYINFQYFPVIVNRVPSLQTGDIIIRDVLVQEGDLIYNPIYAKVLTYSGPDKNMQQMAVRFQLRMGIKWSDGVLLTAYDSVYAYTLLAQLHPHLEVEWQPPDEITFLETASYKALDEDTIEWIGIPGLITNDFPKFFFPPMPQHLGIDLQTDWPTVGWGAYQIVEFTDNHILMKANPYYFRADEGLPTISEVEFRFLTPPYGQGYQPDLISDGECNIISVGIANYTNPKEWLNAAKLSNIQAINIPSNVGLQLAFNMRNDGKNSLTDNMDIRQAIAFCIDRSKLAEEVDGLVANSYIHPLDPTYNSSLLFDFDPEQGRQIIKKFQDQGNVIRFSLAVYDSIQEIGSSIANDLEQCGITIDFDTISNKDYFQSWPDGPIYGSKYDLYIFPLKASEGINCNQFVTDNIPSSINLKGLNVSGYKDPVFDNVCFQALTSLNEKERIRLQKEAQVLWRNSLPTLPLFWSYLATGINCHVKGYTIDPSGLELWNIDEISLRELCD